MNKGFSVNQANAGKKCIGTVNPGNNSGASILKGSLVAKGTRTLAKLSITKMKLNTTSDAGFLSHLFSSQNPIAASTAPKMELAKIFAGLAIAEKSAPSEEVYTFW
jgi:hypothetical protein